MSDSIIKDHSTGLQAGGDINIIQDRLPQAIEEMIVELLKPSIQQIGEQLKYNLSTDISNTIGGQIKKYLEDEVLQSLKEQIKIKNITHHINEVKNKIKKTGEKQPKHSSEPIEESLSKLDLFGDWVEGVERISPDEKTLSGIWEGWLYALSKGARVPDQKIFLEKMKLLNQEDAEVLLKLKNSISIRPSGGKREYIIQKLTNLGLIKRNFNIHIVMLKPV